MVSLLGAAGCGESVAPHAAVTDPAALYMALTFEERAINLATAAPYHTVQLVAIPRNGRGEAMAELSAPTFRLLDPGDSTRLRVTPEGQVTALAAGSQIAVIAELITPGPVRHADTARISVTAGPPPVLASLSIHPLSPESAVWPLGADYPSFFAQFAGFPGITLTPRPLDETGQPIAGLAIEFASLDPTIGEVDRWTGHPILHRFGPVRMVARTTAYGVTVADTALFTITWPIESTVIIGTAPGYTSIFDRTEVRILPHGLVYWFNDLSDSVDVTFDDPTNVATPPAPICELFQANGIPEFCEAGNVLVPGFSNFNFGIRSFPVPGVYSYRSTRTGGTGRIVVTTEAPTDVAGP